MRKRKLGEPGGLFNIEFTEDGAQTARRKGKGAVNTAVTDSASGEKAGFGGIAGGVIVNEGLKRLRPAFLPTVA